MRGTLTSRAVERGRRLYSRALNAVYLRVGLPWAVHNEIVRIDPRVRRLVPHTAEPALFEFIQRTIGPGDTVLDVGSFLGVYAILAAKRVGSAGRVIAFEPTRSSAHFARRHFAYNDVGPDRAQLIEAAVSDRSGRATLHEYAAAYVNSLAPAVDTPTPVFRREVAVVTIDEVCHELDVVPSFIRMDVQGAEIHALIGARNTIRAAGSRLRLVVEMHPQCWPSFGMTESAARETIASLGLVARPLVAGCGIFDRDAHTVLTPASLDPEQVEESKGRDALSPSRPSASLGTTLSLSKGRRAAAPSGFGQ